MMISLWTLALCGISAAAPHLSSMAPLASGPGIKLFRDLSNVPVTNVSRLVHRRDYAQDASSSPSSGSSSSSGSCSSSVSSSCQSSGGASPSNGDIYEAGRTFFMVIGAGAGDLPVFIDTGSNSLVINSISYNGASDPSWSPTGEACQESYGHGGQNSYSGQIYYAPITCDGYVSEVAVCLATVSYGTFGGDGILGLNLNPATAYTAYYQTGSNVLTAMGWTSFGIYLSQANGDGELTPNGYNSAYFASGAQWTYEPLVSADGKWTVGFTGFSIGSASGTPAVQQGTVDTGSPEIILDQASLDAVYSQLDFSGYTAPIINCDQQGVAPPLVLTLGSGAQYSIPSANYIEQLADGRCKVSIKLRPPGRPMNLGFPLTSTYYAWFDVQNKQIGFIESIG